MSRRPLVDPRILVLLTVALCLALLAACGGADTATQAPEADATIAPTAGAFPANGDHAAPACGNVHPCTSGPANGNSRGTDVG